jgi:hypothetical protein
LFGAEIDDLDLQLSIKVSPDAYIFDTDRFIPTIRKAGISTAAVTETEAEPNVKPGQKVSERIEQNGEKGEAAKNSPPASKENGTK